MKIDTENLESLVKQYVLGQLDDNQAEEFEAYFLSNPEVIEMIDAVQKLQTGMQNMPVASSYAAEMTNDSGRNSIISKLLGWLTVPVPAYAMLALAAIILPLSMTGVHTADKLPQLQLVSLDTSTVRSSGDSLGSDISTESGYAAIVVRVKEVAYPEYKLKVSSMQSGDSLWVSPLFAFPSGSRDFLLVVPPGATSEKVAVQLVGITEQAKEVDVAFCNYTEACF